jgi:branched-chain amino acid transport system ATP-binding protein
MYPIQRTFMSNKLLTINNLKVAYDDGVPVIGSVDISIDQRTIVALMGPNGCGKSTVLKALFGLIPHQGGEFVWMDKRFHPSIDVSFGLGISYVPQGRQLFRSLSVHENIEMGGFGLKNKTLLRERIESVLDLFPVLRQKLHEKAGDLSGGQQQMVALARGLVTDPKLLLLDEPTLGLSPKLVIEVFEMIERIKNERDVSIVVVEHNLKSLLRHVDEGYILKEGKIAFHGKGEDLRSLEKVEQILLS